MSSSSEPVSSDEPVSTREPVSRRDRPAKAVLSRTAIVEATLGLIREHGVEKLALRHVATVLDTGPASLYAYFRSREVLLDHALDAVYQQVELVPIAGSVRENLGSDSGEWETALAATVINTIEALERYPGIGGVALGTIPTLPGALRLAEHELALMEAGGIDETRAALAVDLLSQFATATAVERTVRGESSGDEKGKARDAYADADQQAFPRVHALADVLTGADERERRDFSIRLIIAGLAHVEGE